MYSLILRGRRSLELQKWRNLKLLQTASACSKSFSSASAAPQDGRKEKTFTVSYLVDSLFPLLITKFQPVCGKEKFEESLKKVVEMGFDPKTFKFIEALHVVYNVSDKTIQEKVNLYKWLGFAVGDVWSIFKKYPTFLTFSENNILNSMETFLGLGFTRDEVTMMVKCVPQCIGLSAETVKKKTEFVVKQMNWPLKAVVLCPKVFSLSMEKRIVPRCNVIKALLSKGLLGKRSKLPPVSSVLSCTDEKFLNKYVKKHDDREIVAELMAILTRDRVNLSV